MGHQTFTFIREDIADTVTGSVIVEESKSKSYYIQGVTLQSNLKNRNGRIYPKEVLQRSIDSHVSKYLNAGRALGELNHPSQGAASINFENVSHKFVSVIEDGDNFVTKAEVLETPKGMIVRNLIDGGVQLGISSRGLGSIKEDKSGVKIVQELHIVSLGDIVSDPSGPNCFVDAITENKEWVFENGILVEKDMSEELDKYKKIIQESSAADVQKVVKQIFNDYMTKLLS